MSHLRERITIRVSLTAEVHLRRSAQRDAANQFIAFLADPPAGLDGEMPDLKAVHIRLFISYLYAAGRKPSTVNN